MNLENNKVVIGGNLEAFVYAFVHNVPVLYTNLKPPFEYDYLQPDAVLKQINIPPRTSLRTTSGTLTFGPSKLEVWQKLLFLLSLSGRIIYGDTILSAELIDNSLLLNCVGVKRKTIDFKELIIFDDKNIIGLPTIKKQIIYKNAVYDWVNINSGGTHDYDLLQYDDDFVNTIHFYPSMRNNNTRIKDLVCVSYLTDEQLEDFSYSDTYVKFKLLDLFKNLGIRGARNGRDPKRPGYYKYYAVKLEPSNRKITRCVRNEYEYDKRLTFNYQNFNDIVKQYPAPGGYLKRLSELL